MLQWLGNMVAAHPGNPRPGKISKLVKVQGKTLSSGIRRLLDKTIDSLCWHIAQKMQCHMQVGGTDRSPMPSKISLSDERLMYGPPNWRCRPQGKKKSLVSIHRCAATLES